MAAEAPAGSAGTTSSSVSADDPAGWSSARGNATNSRSLPLEDGFPELDTEAWRYELPGTTHATEGRVAVADGQIYVQTETELFALDADDGEFVWESEISSEDRPTVADDTVYVGSQGRVTAFDVADGSVRWDREFDTDGQIHSPAASDGSIYVTASGTLYALDGDDGSSRWERDEIEVRPNNEGVGDPVPASFETDTVAVMDGSVYARTDRVQFGDDDSRETEFPGGIAAIESATGEPEWAIAFEDGIPRFPIAADEFVYAPYLHSSGFNETGPLLDPDTGEHLGDSDRTVAGMSDVRITTFPSRGTISAHTSGSGEDWTISTAEYGWAVPIIAGDTLLVSHRLREEWEDSEYPDSSIIAFDLEDGSTKWNLEVDGPLEIAAVDGNTLYVVANSELVALRASDATPDDGNDNDDEGDGDNDEGDEGDDCECEDGNDDSDEDSGNSDDGSGDEDGGNGGGDGSGDDRDGDDENGDADASDENGDIEDDDGSNGGDDDNASNEDATETDDDDGMPGFTAGAGILGGAATLEWLRRSAAVDESTDVDEPAE
ncbi:hypothetical protein JCM18750_14610 [Halostagnicola bangensis]